VDLTKDNQYELKWNPIIKRGLDDSPRDLINEKKVEMKHKFKKKK
jgi:hypothetical protein